MDKLQEIKASIEKLEKIYQEAKADMSDSSNNDVYYKCMDACYQMIGGLRNYIYLAEDRIYNSLAEHNKGHLPKIQGAEKMKNALETLGIDGDYDIQKPTLWVQANRNGGKTFEAELDIPKKKV